MQINGRSFPVTQEAWAVINAIINAGGTPYIVGGSVRDYMLNLEVNDYDLEIYKLNSEQIKAAVNHLGVISITGQKFRVMKLRTKSGTTFDLSIPRRETKTGPLHTDYIIDADPEMDIFQACLRRDYTVNSAMYNPVLDELYDFYGAMRDVQLRTLRPTSNQYDKDALRVLRGMQIAGRKGFRFASAYQPLTRAMMLEYSDLSRERIWEEWVKWAGMSRYPSMGIEFLVDTGWIDLYPELKNMMGSKQDPIWHPEGDAFVHTLSTVDEMHDICKREGIPYESEERVKLMLAILQHDIAKPKTMIIDTDGRIHNPGHDQLGAAMVPGFMEKIGRVNPDQKSEDKLVSNIQTLVANHMRHVGLDSPSKRTVRRMALDVDNLQHLAYVVEADHSGRKPNKGGLPPQMQAIMRVASEVSLETTKPKPYLKGDILIELGMKQGKDIGRVIAASFEAQLDGEFEDVDGAVKWAKSHLGIE